MTPNLYTTNIAVSQRIKELVGEMESYFRWKDEILRDGGSRSGDYYLTTEYRKYNDMFEPRMESINYMLSVGILVPCFTLSELPEVLKKVGEKLGWGYNRVHDMEIYLYRYLKCCELHAFGQNVDDYLMELLK